MPQHPLIVLGNGPSLRNVDLHKLRDYDTVGMNAAYRYWDRIGWYPTYFCSMDPVVQASHHVEIRRLIDQREKLGIRLFFLRNTLLEIAPELKDHPAVIWLEELLHHPLFNTSFVTTGAFSARLGIYLGYAQIYLMGIDLQYVEVLPEAKVGSNNELILTRTPDHNPNYFFRDYQQAGDRYQIPNPPDSPSVHLESWHTLKEQMRGVAIYNTSEQSRLSVFPGASLGTAETPDTTVPPLHFKPRKRFLRRARLLYRRIRAGYVRPRIDWPEHFSPTAHQPGDIVPRAALIVHQSTGHIPLDSVLLLDGWGNLQHTDGKRWRRLESVGFLMIAHPSEGLRWLHLDVEPEKAGAILTISTRIGQVASFRLQKRKALSAWIPASWGTDTLLAIHTSTPVRFHAITLTT